MTAGDARHGRRDNGLVAAEYAPAGDVDPRVGEHLLEVLALEGIAAYLRPSTDLHPVTRSTILPSRPTDRLYVDRAHVATARDYVTRLANEASEAEHPAGVGAAEGADAGGPTADRSAAVAEGNDSGTDPASRGEAGGHGERGAGGAPWLSGDDVDAAWAEIIAGYDDTAEPVRPLPGTDWPDPDRADPDRPDPDRPDPTAGPTDETATWRDDQSSAGPVLDAPGMATRPAYFRLTPPSRPRPSPSDEPSLLDGLDTFGADLPDDESDRFTPPVPPPVPRPSLPTALAIVGIVGGLAVFLNPGLLSFMMDDGLAMFLGFTAIVTGFATLVWRLRPGDEDDDADPDDGAKV